MLRLSCSARAACWSEPGEMIIYCAEHFEGDVLELLSSIIAGQTGEHLVSALSASYLLTAKRLITEQLGDPALSCERVS